MKVENTYRANRLLCRAVTALATLCAATFHWWLAPVVLIAGELGSRALLAYLSRPSTKAETKKRPVLASELAEATDEHAVLNPAGLTNQSDLDTDPVYHQLPSNVWHNSLN